MKKLHLMATVIPRWRLLASCAVLLLLGGLLFGTAQFIMWEDARAQKPLGTLESLPVLDRSLLNLFASRVQR